MQERGGRIVILVPSKNIADAKQRLAPALTPEERFALAAAMLEDVLDALAANPRRDEVAVVTGDAHARACAQSRFLKVIEDGENPGETGAIEKATRACCQRGAEYTLVIPADIPLVTGEEIGAIFAAAPPRGAVLVPSATGRGTNAALRRPADLFPLRFGNDSFLPHLAAARATGKAVAVLHLPGIGLDVDEPADLAALLALPGETRAQRLLQQWDVAGRLLSAAHG